MSRGVCWHEAPVSLHISPEATHLTGPPSDLHSGTSSTAEQHHRHLASSLSLDARSPQHLIFFGAKGAFVHAAPLHITVTDVSPSRAGASKVPMANVVTATVETMTQQSTKATAVPNAATSFALPSTRSVDTTRGTAAERLEAVVAENDEEWTDAVDEEALAFFGDG
ncbi:hypothetical protein JIQ42_02903 [Leishmania sp. Namibia]|uniref:hypothetical protein n=1 Tax=Leishmania sp. Namibia TaxID=2802991 RepID=UPI001B65AC01|nr:hypothetical protein JIQ42_02903 [Leishmania sp. Namibia]